MESQQQIICCILPSETEMAGQDQILVKSTVDKVRCKQNMSDTVYPPKTASKRKSNLL